MLFGEQLMPKLFRNESGAVRPEADLDRLLTEASSKSSPMPRLALYCGEQDYLNQKQTRVFAEKCKQHGLEVVQHLSEGGHNPAYWSCIVPKVMDWFLSESAE